MQISIDKDNKSGVFVKETSKTLSRLQNSFLKFFFLQLSVYLGSNLMDSSLYFLSIVHSEINTRLVLIGIKFTAFMCHKTGHSLPPHLRLSLTNTLPCSNVSLVSLFRIKDIKIYFYNCQTQIHWIMYIHCHKEKILSRLDTLILLSVFSVHKHQIK